MRVEGEGWVQGEEGALSFMTRPRGADTSVKGRPVNYCAGFRPMQVEGEEGDGQEGFHRETFSMEVDATAMGFEPSLTPRIDRSVRRGGWGMVKNSFSGYV